MACSPIIEADALRMLEDAGCSTCLRGALSETRYLWAFVHELYADPFVLSELRRSLGFCPRHTRLLARQVEAPFVLRAVAAQVVDAALATLHRSPPDGPRAPCPLCAARASGERWAIWLLVRALGTPAVATRYSSGRDLCLVHAVEALEGAGRDAAIVIVKAALARPDGAAPRPGPTERNDDEGALVDLPFVGARTGVLERLGRLLRLETCPICWDGAALEQRYIRWLRNEVRSHPDRVRTEGIRLCGDHAQALAREDELAANHLATLRRDEAQWWVSTLLKQLTEPGPAGWFGGARGLVPTLLGKPPAWRGALGPLRRTLECSLCAAVTTLERRTLELLATAMGDSRFRAGYQESHGICLRHLRCIESPEAAALPRRVLRARLEIIAWELEEAGRKSSWSYRYEARGDEDSAWRRAPVLLDGRSFHGAPAAAWAPARGDQTRKEVRHAMLRM
jgi:hypothetical protein